MKRGAGACYGGVSIVALSLGAACAGDAIDGAGGTGGGSAGPGPSPQCDGSAPAPDYPELGAHCGAHFALRTRGGAQNVDFEASHQSARGAAPGQGTFVIGSGIGGGQYAIALFVPSLAVGAQVTGVEARSVILDTFDSAAKEGAARVHIAGNDGAQVWGDFVANACTFDFDPTCFLLSGRFSASIESAPAEAGYGVPQPPSGNGGFVCLTVADCGEIAPACADSRCPDGGGLCEVTAFVDARCPMSQICTPGGCAPP